MRDTSTRASVKRTLSIGVEAASQGTPQSVSFDTPFQTGERELPMKMNIFIEQGEDATNPKKSISGDDFYYCSEEDTKMASMCEMKLRTFMQMELKACLDEIDWLIRCPNWAVNNCPEEEYPPRPLAIPPNYIDNLQSRLVKVTKNILSPTLNLILKTYYYFPAHQAPVTSPTV